MRLVYMGAGFVGACSAAVSADSGHSVLAFDIDKEKINKLSSSDPVVIQNCLHEEGLAELILQHQDRLTFTSDVDALQAALDKADAIFMCLPTPEKDNGESDLTAFKKATEMLGEMLLKRNNGEQTNRVVLVNKSTVPIDTVDLSRRIMEPRGVKNFGIASNPEFLVEGQAVHDSIHPKRVVVGAENETDLETLRRVYSRFYNSADVVYQEMNPYEAATVKLLSNTALFNKLAYTFSVVGRVCEVIPNLGYEKVRDGIASDTRIGKWGLYDSLYAGGSCLIKDAMSLGYQLRQHGATSDFIEEILKVNSYQLSHFLERAETEAQFSFNGKKVAVLGLAFKQGTNDIRHSGAISIIKSLLGSGVDEIRAHDPAAMDMCALAFPETENELNKKITYCESVESALQGSDCVIICTDWPEFRTVADTIIEECQPSYLIMDGRRMIAHMYKKLGESGFSIVAVGSPFIGATFAEGAK